MNQLALLSQRLLNTPLALHPRKAEVIVSALAERLGITRIKSGAWYDDDEDEAFRRPARESGYDILEGIAVIPVHGTLVQKLGTLRPYSGMTGYDGIRRNFLTALNDPDVKGICLDIDSPGGEVAGCFDLVDTIFACRGQKPVHAILSESAYSAAYAIASAADRILVPRTGGVGSVGVIYVHCDMSRQMKDEGLNVTIITCGSRKAETSPLRPLSEAARSALQADIDATGTLFIETVARNRGISADAVRALEARTLRADEGGQAGLADDVMSPDEAFSLLLKETQNHE
ncbi:serine peptidase [Escherichia coli]|uniref:S49 family peptidase n=1 Tax=Escherichia coli TaxID=562 RepID=UPI00191A9043|nr:S49 family peptidase [Escherichia coli]UMT24988.1 serine peptidase [Escherichia coli]CAD6169340.1 S49 family peptidase [Escherichia coli]